MTLFRCFRSTDLHLLYCIDFSIPEIHSQEQTNPDCKLSFHASFHIQPGKAFSHSENSCDHKLQYETTLAVADPDCKLYYLSSNKLSMYWLPSRTADNDLEKPCCRYFQLRLETWRCCCFFLECPNSSSFRARSDLQSRKGGTAEEL